MQRRSTRRQRHVESEDGSGEAAPLPSPVEEVAEQQHEDGEAEQQKPASDGKRKLDECPICNRDLRASNAGGVATHLKRCRKEQAKAAEAISAPGPAIPSACPRCPQNFGSGWNRYNIMQHFQTHISNWTWEDPMPQPLPGQHMRQATLAAMFAKKNPAPAHAPSSASSFSDDDTTDDEEVNEEEVPGVGASSSQLPANTPCSTSATPGSFLDTPGSSLVPASGMITGGVSGAATYVASGSTTPSQYGELATAQIQLCRGVRLLAQPATPAGNVRQSPVGLNYPFHLHSLASIKKVPTSSVPSIVVNTRGYAFSTLCSRVIQPPSNVQLEVVEMTL